MLWPCRWLCMFALCLVDSGLSKVLVDLHSVQTSQQSQQAVAAEDPTKRPESPNLDNRFNYNRNAHPPPKVIVTPPHVWRKLLLHSPVGERAFVTAAFGILWWIIVPQ